MSKQYSQNARNYPSDSYSIDQKRERSSAPYYPSPGGGEYGDPYYHPPPPSSRSYYPPVERGVEENYQDYNGYDHPPPRQSNRSRGRGGHSYDNGGGRDDYPDFSNSYYPPHSSKPPPQYHHQPPPQYHHQQQQQQPGYYDPSPYYPPSGYSVDDGAFDENAMVYEVRFKCTKDTYRLDPQCEQEIFVGDTVVVETDRGYDAGTVTAIQPADIPMASMYSNAMSSLRCIVSGASEEDFAKIQHNRMEEERALQLCRHLALMRHLPMVVAATEMQFDRRKLTIIFSAERRVDFRELVRDMFQVFKTRIWMQKVSPAEAAALSALYPTSPLPPQGIPIPQTRSLVTLPNLAAESAVPGESYPIYEPIDDRGAPPHRQNLAYHDHADDYHHHQPMGARGSYGGSSTSSSPHTAAAAPADRYYDSEYSSASIPASASSYSHQRGGGDPAAASVSGERRSDYSSFSYSPNSEVHQLTATATSPQLPLSHSGTSPPSVGQERDAREQRPSSLPLSSEEFGMATEFNSASTAAPPHPSPPPGTSSGPASGSEMEFNSHSATPELSTSPQTQH